MHDLMNYAIRRLIFVAIVWGMVTYVVPHLMR
jgi:hypothetical protein